MLFEILKFELLYRFKRPETYLFFMLLFALSIFGVDFIMEGVSLGQIKKNSPLVIAKSMGAITGIFMILASLIMGMPIIRDDQYEITPFFESLPIRKSDYLIGRFVGSVIILILIFSGIPFGMILGEFTPWADRSEMLPFDFLSYCYGFLIIVLPSLFFGASLFFIAGTLSRNLFVVYTQGLIVFVIFLLTRSIENEYLQSLLDPFSLTTISKLTDNWSILQKNTLQLPFSGVLLANKSFWIFLGVLIFIFGSRRFKKSTRKFKKQKKQIPEVLENSTFSTNIIVPNGVTSFKLFDQFKQLFSLSTFYGMTILKERSFWAIGACAVFVIWINSINLGTVYGVDSYPATYLIVEELKELASYFLIIVLILYTGELFWKERTLAMSQIVDATPISTFLKMAGKVVGLSLVYFILLIVLILAGVIFQLSQSYTYLDLHVYVISFLMELYPALIQYTLASFFLHALANNKFLGILYTLIFLIFTVALEQLGISHILFKFGGYGLPAYSEMNGYGHFLIPHFWEQIYWTCFSFLLLMLAAQVKERGIASSFTSRLKHLFSAYPTKQRQLFFIVFFLLIASGSYLSFQTSIFHETWSDERANLFRMNYEKNLKQFEYKPQPNIVEIDLELDLYPDTRSYKLNGHYTLVNQSDQVIKEIHIQKHIDDDIELDSLQLSVTSTLNDQYLSFEHYIFKLKDDLQPLDTLLLTFLQSSNQKGFDIQDREFAVVQNGSFIKNSEFPSLGYRSKYEIDDDMDRKALGLSPRLKKEQRNHPDASTFSRSGSDSKGMRTSISISTSKDQVAITSGELVESWESEERNHYHYISHDPIIDFYAIQSGRYEVTKDFWVDSLTKDTVDLEIYHHQRHIFNIDKMMQGMKTSLSYYSTHFSPYHYRQLRIVEFPRYRDFAQSFPNMIPFSESMGFMLDIDRERDIDMVFFVTAHEVAHQWWGMQVEAANVQGQHFILETLSQYSAMMVLQATFGHEELQKFIDLQKELYEKGVVKAKESEVALLNVTDESHIYYNKGAVVMYEIQKVMGADRLNQSLRCFIEDWNSQNGNLKLKQNRYATSEDLLQYLLQEAPEKHLKKISSLIRNSG